MAARLQYQIVGRYMDGTSVVGYHVKCASNGKSCRLSRDQTAFLVGRNQITNCQGQIYQDKLLLRGVGISLDSLPSKQVSPEESKVKSNNKGSVPTKSGNNANPYTQMHKKVINHIQSELKSMGIYELRLDKANSNKNKVVWRHRSGYVIYEITSADGGFRIDWETANGYDGGAVNGNIKEDLQEAIQYCTKTAQRIQFLQNH